MWLVGFGGVVGWCVWLWLAAWFGFVFVWLTCEGGRECQRGVRCCVFLLCRIGFTLGSVSHDRLCVKHSIRVENRCRLVGVVVSDVVYDVLELVVGGSSW